MKSTKLEMSKSKKHSKAAIEDDVATIAATEKIRERIMHPSRVEKEKVLRTVPFQKVTEWISKSYSSQVPKISLKVPIDYDEGMIKRLMLMSTIKYGVLDNGLTNNTIVFKLHDSTTRKETNYAIMLCNTVDSIPKEIIKLMFAYGEQSVKLNDYYMLYVSTGPSLISCDGEYRSRLVQYMNIYNSKWMFPQIWHEIDEYMSIIIPKRGWSLYASYFSPEQEKFRYINTALEQLVKNELLSNKMLNIAWFQTIYNEMLGMSETHMNVTYKEIMLAEYETDKLFIQELIKKYSAEEVEKFKVSISVVVHNIVGTNKNRYLQLGLKMIPLNIIEVQQPFDIRYKPWREFFISTRCSDLVPNQIAPGFPIIGNYYYVQNSKKGLYDNKSQFERVKNSELAKDILHTLYEAQRGTYFASSNIKAVSKTSEQIKKWIGSKFRKLSEKIDDPINYAIEEIIMSDISLFMTSEFVGKTVADIMQLIPKNKMFDDQLGKPLSDGGFDYFAKYMFEICYNLLAFNKRIGAIHGDFHLNNATIGYLYPNTVDHAKVAYFIGDVMYLFPNNGYFGCIIDFSRSLIEPSRCDELRDMSLPLSSKLTDNMDKFAAFESNILLGLYIQLFPNKAEQKEELSVLFKRNFPAVFKLLTCIDMYMFTIRLSRLLQQMETPVSKKSIELVEKIGRFAESFIATDMNHLLNDPDTFGAKVLANEWPMETVIKKCFPEYINGSAFKKLGTVTDCYNIDNPMKYSLTKYDTFPECLQTSKYEDEKGELHDIAEIHANRLNARREYEKIIRDNFNTIRFLGTRYLDIVKLEMR